MTENSEEANNSSDLSAIVGALLDTLDDKNYNVRKIVKDSIRRISKSKAAVVVHAAVYFWELHRKISTEHLSAILTVISDTCRDYSKDLDENLAASVTELAIAELSGSAEMQAYDIFVALSKTHCKQTMGGLLARLEPGTLPHHTMIRAMGMIAGGNPFEIIPFSKITLSIILHKLNDVQEDLLKSAICFTIGKFSEAINDYLMNTDESSNPGFCKDAFIEEFPSMFDTFANNWLRSTRDSKQMDGLITTLGSILPLLPKNERLPRATKLVPVLINYSRRNGMHLACAKVLAIVFDSACEDEKAAYGPLLEQAHTNLSDLICVTPFEVSREVLLTHYEVLQCFRSIVIMYPEEGLDRVLQQLKSSMSVQRSKALIVLKHLVNTLPVENDGIFQRIAVSLQDSLGDSNAKQMIAAIVALTARSTVSLLPTQRATFVRFLIMHCGEKSEDSEAYEEALYLLASTVEGAEIWLWPTLIRTLLDPVYAASVISILRALAPLASKIIRSENWENVDQKDFHDMKVLARCIELLCEEKNRVPVVSFLRNAAPLFGEEIGEFWDSEFMELSKFLESVFINKCLPESERNLMWEEKIVNVLEQSVKLQGDAWAAKLAKELTSKAITPSLSVMLAAISRNEAHVSFLIELSRTQHGKNSCDYSRAVGICAKWHLELVLKTMEESCNAENAKKTPVKLLGLVKDSKAAATAEAAKAGLLRSYAEIARRGNSEIMLPDFQRHAVLWIVRQLNECKEIGTREAALEALEQIGYAVHPDRLENSKGLRARGTILATLLGILQLPSGYRPLQIYPYILKATIAMIRIPPVLNPEEKEVLLSTMLDKTIAISSESISMSLSGTMQEVVKDLATVCTEVVGDSADALAQLVDILVPWMQSTSCTERKAAVIVLRSTLRSYYDSLKYTFPGGNLQPGKLLGKILSWSADPEHSLRPIVVDCVALCLSIGTRHRTSSIDINLNHDLNEIKKIIISEDHNILYEGVKTLASSACERIPSGEVISLAEGLIEGLLSRGESGFAAGIALSQLFSIRGSEIPRVNLCLVDSIISQMRLMENASCKHTGAVAIRSLMEHHPQEVVEQLLRQPLPLDPGTELCWRELGHEHKLGAKTLDILLDRLENNFVLTQNALPSSPYSAKNNTASSSSLSAILALGNLLQSSHFEALINLRLADLLAILMKYLSGWLYANAPLSVVNTKFGFIPNRESCKISPCKSVYSVLINVLTVVDAHESSCLLNDFIFDSESQAENRLIYTLSSVSNCLIHQEKIVLRIAKNLGNLMTSMIPAQRAIATAAYSEVIGKKDCDPIWLDAIINSLHEAKKDSSPFVRKLATIGLTKIAYLEAPQFNEYFDNCLSAFLDGLEEPATGGGNEVVLESLRGISILLSVKTVKPISPHIVLAIKPFVEKDDWETRLTAIGALASIFNSWKNFPELMDDDVTYQVLNCLPCLMIKLEDPVNVIAEAVRKLLFETADLTQCEPLIQICQSHFAHGNTLNIEKCLGEVVNCLQQNLPQRAEELRNAVVMGYSRSENSSTRAVSALILGLFGVPRPEDIQRLLQLLKDTDSTVKIRAAHALALSFTL